MAGEVFEACELEVREIDMIDAVAEVVDVVMSVATKS